MLPELLTTLVGDGGPIYWETGKGVLFVEDINALSSLFYLIPAAILFYKASKAKPQFWFILLFASPLLFVGGIGSTIYHALRSERWIMLLDVMPIFTLTLGIAYYFLYGWLQNLWLSFLLVAIFVMLRFASFELFPLQSAINISYFIIGVLIFIPSFFYARKLCFREIHLLVLSAIFFILSLFFRFVDDCEGVAIIHGTHWLWHVFSASGALFLGLYLYRTRIITLKK